MGKSKPKANAGPIRADALKSYVERVERLEEERGAIGSDIRDVYSEAKGSGYDVKTMRWMVQERKVDSYARDERDALRDTYAHALGMAVNMVLTDGLSQREAAKRTGVSKSSVNRALAVPEVSQDDGARQVRGTEEGIGHNSKRACILLCADAWQEITSARDSADAAAAAEIARIAAEKVAERERRRLELEELKRRNAEIDADTLAFPPHLNRLQQRALPPNKEK